MRPRKDVEYERLLAQEELILDATETIVALLEERGISRQELAARLGKSKSFVSQLLSGERNMTLRTLGDVGYALGHTFSLGSRSDAASKDAEALRSTFAAYSPKTAMRASIPAKAVRDRMRATEDASVDIRQYALTHEYDLAA
jgi:transcriptional regulator with XRE-family HTH domain